MEKAYFLNTSTSKLHISEHAGKVCKNNTLQEHIKYFDTIEEAKGNSDKRIVECKFCFYRQLKNIE
ncbi:MAG: hypothetical protein IKC45_00725 [Clostridia bacterium]|nr:hypothetical protein [Clostridia bacterium]